MSKPILHYMEGKKGRAFGILLAAAKAGMDVDYKGVTMEQVKGDVATYPCGTVPIMEVEGKTLYQSFAIMTYIGRKGGLVGKTPIEEAKIFETCMAIEDFFARMFPTFRLEGDAKKAARQDVDVWATAHFAGLDKIIGANGSSKFVVGDSMSIADIMIFQVGTFVASGMIDDISTTLISQNPNMARVITSVSKDPKVQEHLKSVGMA